MQVAQQLRRHGVGAALRRVRINSQSLTPLCGVYKQLSDVHLHACVRSLSTAAQDDEHDPREFSVYIVCYTLRIGSLIRSRDVGFAAVDSTRRSRASGTFELNGRKKTLHHALAQEPQVLAAFADCVERLMRCDDDDRVVYVTGIGKSGIVAQRFASTLASISVRSRWIHGSEWTHGELGNLRHGDVESVCNALVEQLVATPRAKGSRSNPQGKSIVWEKHYQQQQQRLQQHPPSLPTRPQTGRRIGSSGSNGFTTNSPISPRQLVPATPSKQRVSLAVSSPKAASVSSSASSMAARCQSAGVTRSGNTRSRISSKFVGLNKQTHLMTGIMPSDSESASLSTPRKSLLTTPTTPREQYQTGLRSHSHPDDTRVEEQNSGPPFQVFLEINPEALREQAQQKIERLKLQKFVNQGSVINDGSVLETAKRKTSFLLRHFFSLTDQQILVPKSDPDCLSIVIAVDCLKKLAQRLPAYQRVLDVVLCILESGLYVHATSASTPHAVDDCGNADDHQHQSHRFYFQERQALQDALDDARASVSSLKKLQTSHQANLSIREQIAQLLSQLSDQEPLEKEALFLTFLQSNMDILACLTCTHVRRGHARVTGDHSPPHCCVSAIPTENLDAMDQILMHGSATSGTGGGSTDLKPASPSQALFQRLIERHPTEFASILWQSLFLTAHVFQDSQSLVARILEQNIFLISQVLLQRQDVLLSLLNHTLKDSMVCCHASPLISILYTDIAAYAADRVPKLASSVPFNARQRAAWDARYPDLHPEDDTRTARDDPTLLSMAFTLVPQSLSDTLETHPEFFVDIAHRKPALVTRLFAKYPDLLMKPLEANPMLFSNFLVYHRDVLPDLSDPNFNPMLFQLESKKFEDNGTQTSANLVKLTGKLRIHEALERQRDGVCNLIRSASAAKSPPPCASSMAFPVHRRRQRLLLEKDLHEQILSQCRQLPTI
ncbi:hypothetical protein FI667_g1885, partial [Globisporangium splendens]